MELINDMFGRHQPTSSKPIGLTLHGRPLFRRAAQRTITMQDPAIALMFQDNMT